MSQESDVFILGGCGHVGLPLGIMLANAGLKVVLCDIHEERLRTVRAGRMPFIEYGADPILKRVLNKKLFLTDRLDGLSSAKSLIITIGTPVDEYQNPKASPLFNLVRSIAPHLREGQQVILRSTVCPGTTREIWRILKTLPVKVHLSNCPERISQGYAILELTRLPQIVSGLTPKAEKYATALFSKLGCRITHLQPEEAEFAKLFLNAWRYIQFGIANQFYMMATQRGFDFFKIYDAMTTGYDRASDFPLPGFTAGPCLLKDTLQLAAVSADRFLLGHAAMLVNEGLPKFIVENLRNREEITKKTVGILGMAFKANIDDTRDSLAFKLKKSLQFYGAKVLCSDPFVKNSSFVSEKELLKHSDIVIIGAPHDAYRSLRFPSDTHIVDIWGMTRVKKPAASGLNGKRRSRARSAVVK